MKKAVTLVFLLGIVLGFVFFLQVQTPTGQATKTICKVNNEDCNCDSEICVCGETRISSKECYSNNNL